MILAVVLILFALFCFYMAWKESVKPKSVGIKYVWGKHIPDDITTPIDELETWWDENKSKDAEIKRLNELVASKSTLLAKYQGVVRRGNDDYIRVLTPTLSDPGKVMILPDPVTHEPRSKAGVTFAGPLADAIMSKEVITSLKIHDGSVVEWSVESFNRW